MGCYIAICISGDNYALVMVQVLYIIFAKTMTFMQINFYGYPVNYTYSSNQFGGNMHMERKCMAVKENQQVQKNLLTQGFNCLQNRHPFMNNKLDKARAKECLLSVMHHTA